MFRIIGLCCLALIACACSKDKGASPVTPSLSQYEQLKQMEKAAVQQGLIISEEETSITVLNSTFKPTTISWSGVGLSEPELNSAISTLRNYYQAVEDYETNASAMKTQRLEATEAAISALQSKRNALLTKAICNP